MKQVLLAVYIDTHFVELLRVARLLKGSGAYEPLIWFQSPYPTLERDLAVCRAEKLRFVALPLGPDSQGSMQSEGRWWRNLLKRLPAMLKFFPLVLRSLTAYRRQLSLMKDFLEQHKPDLLVVAEDNIENYLYILIKVARWQGIPAVIVPFTIAGPDEPAEHYFNRQDLIVSGSLVNRLIGCLYPHWVYTYKGRKLLLISAFNVLALEILGLSPRWPWIKYTEETSVIAVESELMSQNYRKDNIPCERLAFTGALYDDVLSQYQQNAQSHRADLFGEFDLEINRPLLLCSPPPNQFPRPCEFEDYEQLTRFWMQALSDLTGWNVLVRPHPRLTREEIAKMKEFGVKITERDTASLVPLCDLYVASVSATIRWAIACGKPVINYDVYQVGWEDFKNAKGVIRVDDQSSFVAALRRLTMEPGYYAQISALQREDMAQWGKLDGKSGERMLRLFSDVISTGGK